MIGFFILLRKKVVENIAYLIGAGASAGFENRRSLPIVDEIPDCLDTMVGILKEIKMPNEHFHGLIDVLPSTKPFYLEELVKDLQWLRDSGKNHASVDTLAKKLFIKKDQTNFNRVKEVLSAFFVIQQVLKPVDMRYDSFYASVLDSTNKIPSNIKILSWNYDSQFELAFTEYSNSANFKEIETELGILKPKYSIEPNKKHNIFKINGTADFYEDGKTDSLYFLNRSSNKLDECISEILSQYSLLKVTSNTHTRLRFAWETNGIMPNDVVTVACEEISQTDVLVVIGYSFPFFNREVDRRIINSMGRLEKIYIQDLDPKDVFERFKAVRDGFENLKFIPINKVKQFFLPNEL